MEAVFVAASPSPSVPFALAHAVPLGAGDAAARPQEPAAQVGRPLSLPPPPRERERKREVSLADGQPWLGDSPDSAVFAQRAAGLLIAASPHQGEGGG